LHIIDATPKVKSPTKMKIRKNFVRNSLRKSYLLFEYIFWLFFDFSKFRKINTKIVNNVLLVHLGAVGELIVTTILARGLKDSLGCRITYMVSRYKEPFIQENPLVDDVITYKEDYIKDLNKIKEGKFDMALIVSPASAKIAKLCFDAGIKYRIGGFGGLKRFPPLFFTRRNFPLRGKHSIDRNLNILNQIGISNPNPNPKTEIYFDGKKGGKLKKKLKNSKVTNYIIVHPCFGGIVSLSNPSNHHKFWPCENYAALIDELLKIYKGKVILGVGTKKEGVITDEIFSLVSRKSRIFVGTGKFEAEELYPLVNGAKLVIAPDTGIGHIAAALKIPLVNIMGDISPEEWAPIGDKSRIINIFHQPYINIFDFKRRKFFLNSGGIKSIKVKEVLGAVRRLLRK